jgi:L-ascorbate metabolism protein UlaG (beta-lactamase superfamily)
MAASDGMRIIKYEHATVRVEQGGHVIVIDPGIATRAASVEGGERDPHHPRAR